MTRVRAERRSIYLPPWRIDLSAAPSAPRVLPASVLARAVTRALEAAGAPSPGAVGVRLTVDAELAALNRRHMGVSGPTDVLSFPILPPDAFPPHEGGQPRPDATGVRFPLPPRARQPLGDIVVSVERAVAQAAEGRGGQTGDIRWSAADELRLLVTHGALHLCGWDHAEPAEETAMRAVERHLLTRS